MEIDHKIKVLIVAGDMDVGGIENQLMHLLRQADKSRFKIDFTTTAEHPFYMDEILSLGSECILIPKTEGRHFLRYCCALYRVLRGGQYDVVHTHELFHSGMVLLTARLAGVKHRFVHAHNWSDGSRLNERPGFKRSLYNAVMRKLIQHNANVFVACSSLAGEFLYGRKITEQKNYHLVYNSVDTSKFLDRYEHKESGVFTDDAWANVLQVGRYTQVKNQLFTVEIAAELKRRGRKIRILSVGDHENDYGTAVQAAILQNGVQDYMQLLGVRKDIDILMRKSQAFILPSKYEGMPLVLIEAQSSGLRCVVADTFSREVDFNIGTVTWLPETASAAEWVEAIELGIASPRPDKGTVQNAVTKYGFDSAVFAKKITSLYEASFFRK